MTKRILTGDIFLIEIANHGFAISKAIFVSKCYPNAVVISTIPVLITKSLSDEDAASLDFSRGDCIFGSKQFLYKQKKLTNAPVSAGEEQRLFYLSEALLYFKDEPFRLATPSDSHDKNVMFGFKGPQSTEKSINATVGFPRKIA